MRLFILLLLPVLLASGARAAEPVQAEDETLDARLDADFDGDGIADIAYIAGNDEKRALYVSVTGAATEYLPLETTPLGPGTLSFAKGVLIFEDLTEGTTAVASTRRYRYDSDNLRMGLIGIDATLYSRTYAHDGFELSWNLLTGRMITRELHLNESGRGDAAYDPIVERKRTRKSAPVYLFDTPDPEELIERESGH
ncbi:hypothetical protein GRI89_13200 [Altererythrobacter salegens]|uniref:VCBS repeat-containing protein n=1 Tax=Croceibacterium salegens TaxID=1737568 RepID=A0A6I4T017_9SPHN|nr:hypothetical protein [Croceibacterium salegens]MXO60496.1 hypothetical protein [Croceibacterium salegens]